MSEIFKQLMSKRGALFFVYYFLWFTGLHRLLSDKAFISLHYRINLGKIMNWEAPQTFTEKLQWLKLYDRRSEYTTMVDKYAVKKYVADIIGEEYIIPTLGVWDRPEDIDWDSLPEQFVLKCTHDSGGLVICKNKKTLDKSLAIKKLTKSLSNNYYLAGREWPYKNVPRRIIAEQYMEETTSDSRKLSGDLSDYKFFCFNGKPEFCQVIRDRHANETIDFYSMDWSHQEFVGLNPVAHNGLTPVARPENFELMKNLCQELAKDIPFVRVDLYSIGSKVYFGELTLYPACGFGKFEPEEWDYKFGEWLKLPPQKNQKLTC